MSSHLALLGSLCFRGIRWQCARSFVANHCEIWACIPWTMHMINFKIKSTCCYNNNVVLERSLDAVHVIHRRHLCKSLTSRFWFRFADLAKHVNMTGLHSSRTCCSSLDLVLELQTFGSPVLCTCCSWTVSNKRCSQLCQIYHYEFKPGKKASANNQHGFNIPSLFWCQIMLSCFSFRTINCPRCLCSSLRSSSQPAQCSCSRLCRWE